MAQSGGDMTDNHAYKLSYEDGSVMMKVPTGLGHAGGITVGGGNVWVAADYDLTRLDLQGNILDTRMAPGGRGAHGLHWVDEHNMWIVDPGAFKVDLVDPDTMEIKRSVPTPIGKKAHGMFVHEGYLWQGVTRKDLGGGEIYQIDMESGEVLRRIDIPEPEVHGLAHHEGLIWLCCAKSNRVCTVPMAA
jgi:streptogramin lyase